MTKLRPLDSVSYSIENPNLTKILLVPKHLLDESDCSVIVTFKNSLGLHYKTLTVILFLSCVCVRPPPPNTKRILRIS
jgi:hypothetical protein